MLGTEKTLIVSTMKNEGPYIVEWVAHHLAVGFDGFLVFTNDCDDLTDRILERLERLVPVFHRPNPKALLRDQGNWQVMAIRYARMFNVYRDADWIYHTDVDEFLWIKTGAGRLDDFAAAAGPFDAVSFTSMPFGSSGLKYLEDRPITQQFTVQSKPYARLRSEDAGPVGNAVKTLLRNSVPFTMRRNHRPYMPHFSTTQHVWINGSGHRLGSDFTDGEKKSIDALVSTDLAQFNHYAIKSAEAFLVKVDRGDVAGTTRLDSNRKYWEGYDFRGDPETGLTTPSPRFVQIHGELMSDSLLAEMHAESLARHKAKVQRILGTEAGEKLGRRLGLIAE